MVALIALTCTPWTGPAAQPEPEGGAPAPGVQPDAAPPDEAADGADTVDEGQPVVTPPIFDVDRISVRFYTPIEGHDPSELLSQPFRFTIIDGVYTAPQPGTTINEFRLDEFNDGMVRQFDRTALQMIANRLVELSTERFGLIGIVVGLSGVDIPNGWRDRREGDTGLEFVVVTLRIEQIRTLASGERITENLEDNPAHDSIREGSPLKAGEPPAEGADPSEGTGDLLRINDLNDYLYRLNRHPGRRVDAAVSRGLGEYYVTLDYLVSESKPWYAYFQLSNTGTDTTGEVRERFGFTHNQLTGSDDILAIDFVTSSFDESNAFSISYERPLDERWSARFSGRFSDYTAADVGFALVDFNGTDFAVGADLVYTFAQIDDLFFDAVGGLQFLGTRTENSTAGTEGSEQFLLGHAGVEVSRTTDIAQTSGYVDLMWNFNAGDPAELTDMGRVNPDERFVVLGFGVTHSFYLEPILNYAAWSDISDPDTSTLAHEVVLGLRGQTALGGRLIPTFESTAGGAYTVRGYDESAVSGDNAVIATAEYRFHVPRAFGLGDPDATPLFGEPFRVTPETVYGQADWDFVLKAFIDAAHVTSNDALAFEPDETLVGAGVGFEISYKNNVRFRGDWGVALEEAGPMDNGDNRFHFFLTLLY